MTLDGLELRQRVPQRWGANKTRETPSMPRMARLLLILHGWHHTLRRQRRRAQPALAYDGPISRRWVIKERSTVNLTA
jgi:hypothetical protein